MTRGDGVSQLLFMINEPDINRFGMGLPARLINHANRYVQGKILQVTRRFWYADGYCSWPPEERRLNVIEKLDFAGKGAPTIYLSHGHLLNSGPLTRTNPVTPFVVTNFRVHHGANAFAVFPAAPGDPAYAGVPSASRRYPITFQGPYWIMDPSPTETLYCYAEWVPVLPDIPEDSSFDSVPLLGGAAELEDSCMSVVFRAAIVAKARLGADTKPMERLLAESLDLLFDKERPTAASPMKVDLAHG